MPKCQLECLVLIACMFTLLGNRVVRSNKLLLNDLCSCQSNGMSFLPPVLLLASIGAMRPVFMIIMGVFLLLTVWRITRGTSGWAPRILMAGALMLAFGYAVVMPLYQGGMIVPVSSDGGALFEHTASQLGWHLAKMVSMNCGWLLLGLGSAMHAGLFETEKSTAPVQVPISSSHEPVR